MRCRGHVFFKSTFTPLFRSILRTATRRLARLPMSIFSRTILHSAGTFCASRSELGFMTETSSLGGCAAWRFSRAGSGC